MLDFIELAGAAWRDLLLSHTIMAGINFNATTGIILPVAEIIN
jgi:hypothetical protein